MLYYCAGTGLGSIPEMPTKKNMKINLDDIINFIAKGLFVFLISFICYKTITTPNTIEHCEIKFDSGKHCLIGKKQWVRFDVEIGCFWDFNDALQIAKTINCKVGN
jgi:hypothetical protein